MRFDVFVVEAQYHTKLAWPIVEFAILKMFFHNANPHICAPLKYASFGSLYGCAMLLGHGPQGAIRIATTASRTVDTTREHNGIPPHRSKLEIPPT